MERHDGTDRQAHSHGFIALIVIGVIATVIAGVILVLLERSYLREESASDEDVAGQYSEPHPTGEVPESTESPIESISESGVTNDEPRGTSNTIDDALDARDDPWHPQQVVRIFSETLSASSTLPASSNISYDAGNLADENRDTAWIADQAIDVGDLETRCEQDPDGSFLELDSSLHPTEWLQWDFYREVTLTHLEIVNGYSKRDDLFSGNSRVRTVRFVTDDGPAEEVNLADSSDVQEVTLGGGLGLNTQRLVMEITSVYCGTGIFVVEGETVHDAGYPALTSAIPYGPLVGAVSKDVRDRGLIVADMLPHGEDSFGNFLTTSFAYPTSAWIALEDEVVEPVSAEWRFAWEDSRLLIEAIVSDSDVKQPYLSHPSQLYRGDSINFEVGPDARCLSEEASLRPLDRHYLIAPTETSGYLRNAVNVPNDDRAYFKAGRAVSILGFAEVADPGYVIRAEVNLSSSLLAGTAGHVLAANFNVSDVYGHHARDDALEEVEWLYGGMASTNPARVDAVVSGATNTRPHLWGTLVLRPGTWTNDLLYQLQAHC